MTIILVRHAPTADTGVRYCGRSDPALDAAGRLAADRLAASLGPTLLPGARIVASPLRRALETASRLATAVPGTTVEIDPRWREADFGVAEGRTFDELRHVAPLVAERLLAGEVAIDWPGGETDASLRERVGAAWAAVALAAGGGDDDRRDLVVVTHGGPLRVALALAGGVSPADVAVPAAAAFVHVELAPAG